MDILKLKIRMSSSLPLFTMLLCCYAAMYTVEEDPPFLSPSRPRAPPSTRPSKHASLVDSKHHVSFAFYIGHSDESRHVTCIYMLITHCVCVCLY